MKKTILTSCFMLFYGQTSLIADDSYEPNNSFSTAKYLTKGSYILGGFDKDYFKLDLKTGKLSLTMTPLGRADLNMVLYNENGEIVAANWNSSEEIISYDVIQSGIYYISVEPTSIETTDYKLEIDYNSMIVWTKTLPFGPIRDVSTTLFDIDKDGKDEIFVATSKGLDAELNEVLPAGLICLEDDGTVKWSTSFPAIDGVDPQVGKKYYTTSVSSVPFFSDIDNDGDIDILVGVGADTFGEAGSSVVGQPGDKGGVYALNSDGTVKWFHESLDTIGGSENIGDGRPDGVYGSIVVYDLDKDGNKEVIYNGWDQYTWVLDAKNGREKLKVHLLDTIWSTPHIVDIDEDGEVEILVNADITENSDAQTQTGGIFHIISIDGNQTTKGFDIPVGASKYPTLKGKAEEQALWSSPITADIDNDGHLEIIYGTGNYFHDNRGEYIRVWNYDGTLKFKLDTIGRTFATPTVADIDNDGKLEILATTLEGYLYCWNSLGEVKFMTQTYPYKSSSTNPIFSSPIALDIDNDGIMEIMYTQGAQVIIVNAFGEQISNSDRREMIFEQFKGSISVKDIDNDRVLDILSGGTTPDKKQAVVYRWNFNNPVTISDNAVVGKYQLLQSNQKVQQFVERFYDKVLHRKADPVGSIYWTDELTTGVRAGADVAKGFIFSDEFVNQNLDDQEFITTLYQAFFNREPDIQGFNLWAEKMAEGSSRLEVLDGFIYSKEFFDLCKSYNILAVKQ
jgi:hypothetical protein